MTIEQRVLFLTQEYDCSGQKLGKISGCRPRISMTYDRSWCVRMVNDGDLPCFFWNNGEYVDTAVSGKTQEEALDALEKLCAERKAAGDILADPAAVTPDGRSSKRVTLNDIARKVGCSRAAVSFAIQGKHSISNELKMKIFAELERSNYRPSAGRSGLSRKSVVILQRVFDMDVQCVDKTAALLMKRGYNPIVCFLPLYEPLNEKGLASFAQIREIPNVAGILSLHPLLESVDILRYSGDVPVTIHCRPDSMLSNIYYDFSAAGKLVASLICRYKHRKAAFVSYGEFNGREYQQFVKGFKEGNSAQEPAEIFDVPVPAAGCNLKAVTSLCDEVLAKGCTFFFAQSEEHCALIKLWTEQRGLSIPEDISLLYLDYDRIAEQLRPAVSAVVIPAREIQQAVIDEMICKIEHKPLPQKVFYPYIREWNTIAEAKNNSQ